MTAVARAAFPGWHPHPDVWALVVLLEGAYLLAVTRGQGASRRKVTAYTCGVLVIWLASDYPIHDLAEHYLYSLHMVQHLLLTLVAAPLLLLGTPAWLFDKLLSPKWLRSAVRGAAKPVPNLLQFNTILVLSHWPLIVTATLRHHPLHFVAHAVLLTSAIVMWLPVVSPSPREVPRLAPLAQMVYLFLQTIIPTIPASFLTFGRTLLYPIYGTFPRLWGASAITDQQVAGLIMKIGAGAYLWIVIAVIFFKWYAREEATQDVLLWDDVARELESLDKKK